MQKENAIFIAGADVNAEKMLVSTWICYHTGADYWKPVQTRENDRAILSGLLPESIIHRKASYLCNPKNLSPSSQEQNMTVNLEDIKIPETRNPLVIEGISGVAIKKNPCRDVILNLVSRFGIPVLLVAKNAFGAINQTCLAIEELGKKNISVLGVILGGTCELPNKEAIEHFTGIPVLATLPPAVALFRQGLEKVSLPEIIRQQLQWN